MRTGRAILHGLRDWALPLATTRPFSPIESPRRRIVLVRPDHFGDLLMLSPALEMVRQYGLDDEIILMTGPWNEGIARHIVDVDNVVTFPFPGFARDADTTGILSPYQAIGEAAAALRELEPRAIILLRDDHWWGAIMAREAGIPLRFGYAHPTLQPFLTHPMEVRSRHYVEQNAEIIERSLIALGYELNDDEATRAIPNLRWAASELARSEAARALEQAGVSGEYIVVHPGTGAPVKRWPIERWAIAIDALIDRTGYRVVLTGTQGEKPLTQGIAERARTEIADLSGKTSLFALAEVFRGARLVLGVDSGPLHLATAVDAPSIHIYGPSDEVRYGPWGDPERHRVVSAGMCCPQCGDLHVERPEGCGCMVAVGVDDVLDAATEVLRNGR